MSQQFQGLRWLIDRRMTASILGFDRIYRQSSFDMREACRILLEQTGVEIHVKQPWSCPNRSILFVSHHTNALDGFAVPLVAAQGAEIQRVIFAPTSLAFGREFMRRNILVYPKGSYRNLIYRNTGLWNQMIYLMTHRWGPFATKHGAVHAMCRSLHRGACVSLLPSGVVGVRRWRSGIGSVLLEAPLHNQYDEPIYLAPIYMDWNRESRTVLIDSPGLIRFESLLKQARSVTNRDSMTDWLQDQYDRRAWEFDIYDHKACRPASSR